MVTASDDIYCYHFNATGSTMAMTDYSEAIINKYAYTPFGMIISEQETVPQPFKFAGQYGVMAEPDGLYYMRARYYDPQVGRFISEDPVGFEGGDTNLYVYASNNPIMLIDPLGLCSESGTIWNPANTLKWGGKILSASGAKATGLTVSIVGVTLEPGGPGETIGTLIGGGVGVPIGTTLGTLSPIPGGALIGGASFGVGLGIAGGKVGSWIDSMFVPHAGEAY